MHLLEQLQLGKNSSDNSKYWQGYKQLESYTLPVRKQNETATLEKSIIKLITHFQYTQLSYS